MTGGVGVFDEGFRCSVRKNQYFDNPTWLLRPSDSICIEPCGLPLDHSNGGPVAP